jgi:glycosyltransferase EpsF
MAHGGAEAMVMELLRHKDPRTQMDFLIHHGRGHVIGSAAFDAEIHARGARLMPIVTPAQSGPRAYLRAFDALVKAHGRPDVIHIHLNARSGIVVLAARRNRIPRIIVHSHAVLTFRGSHAYRMLAQAELQLSKLLFAAFATDFWGCSREAIASLFARRLSRRQPRVVVSNAINVDLYVETTSESVAAARADLSGGRAGLLIGTVGRIVRHKNAAFLIEILAALRDRGIEATVAIVGREEDAGYCAEMRERAAALRLTDAVRLVGSRDDIPAVMAAFDVFVSPALREGFGLVALEAQAAGTPAVLSTGFPMDVDMDLGVVRTLERFDAEAWAEAVIEAARIARPAAAAVAPVIADRGFSASENTRRIERAWREPSFLPGARA